MKGEIFMQKHGTSLFYTIMLAFVPSGIITLFIEEQIFLTNKGMLDYIGPIAYIVASFIGLITFLICKQKGVDK